MADHRELKELYQSIETHETEIARYRDRLAVRLRQASAKPKTWGWLWLGAPLLTGIAAWILFVNPASSPPGQSSLQELRYFVVSSSNLDEIRAQSRALRMNANGLASLDADMLLCLSHPDGQALRAAARGAVRDPRPDFRAYYVEYLLDHADSYQLDFEGVESAMEKEVDPLSLELYAQLLRMAEPRPTSPPSA